MAKTRDVPPHDEELERATLGSLLFDTEAVDAAKQNHLKESDFYSRSHQRIYKAISDLDSDNLRPDIQTVIQKLRHSGKLDEAGGAAYVSSLTSIIPSSANIEYYVQAVMGHSLRRALLRVASEIGVAAYDESRDTPEILDTIEQSIYMLRDERQAFSYQIIKDVLYSAFDKIEEVYKTKQPLTGIPTGLAKLDAMTTGFQPSDFVVIGARPSVGKTALALNMALHIAHKERRPVGFFSLEMPQDILGQRLISSEALIDGNKLRSGFLTRDDFVEIRNTLGQIFDMPLFIIDQPNMMYQDIRSQARKLRAKEGVEIIFIDYLGLIGSNNKLPRHEQIQEISRSLKGLARELKIPIVVLCQLNRENERTGHGLPPTLANLRDSGSIEQDADIVMFLHKPSKKAKKGEEEPPQYNPDGYPTELHIAKQRNGPIGMIELLLQAKYTRFIPKEKEH